MPTTTPYDYDPSPITVLKERVFRARIEHKCSICGRAIPAGSKYRYFFVRDDDAIPPRAFSSYQHFQCGYDEDEGKGSPDE